MRKLTPLIIGLLVLTGLNAAFWFRYEILDFVRGSGTGPISNGAPYETAKDAEDERERILAEIAAREDAGAATVDVDDAAADDDGRPEDEDAPSDIEVEDDERAGTVKADGWSRDSEIRALAVRRTEAADGFNLAVPFTPQAPYAVWDELHNEACEEASAVMVKAFLDGETDLPPAVADERILDIAAYETATFGSHLDTDAEQTAAFMRDHLGMTKARVVPVASIEDVTSYVATGVPVIVPAYGKALGNAYFSGDGPVYHMLVVKGFKDDLIITNDPGTKRGADYVYDAETLWNAIHDWNDGDVRNGRKVMIVPE